MPWGSEPVFDGLLIPGPKVGHGGIGTDFLWAPNPVILKWAEGGGGCV